MVVRVYYKNENLSYKLAVFASFVVSLTQQAVCIYNMPDFLKLSQEDDNG